MPTFSPLRAAVTLLILACLLGAMPLRVAYLETFGRERTLRSVDRQQHQDEMIPARRGSIFDQSGILMAGTIETQTCFIDPKFMLEYYGDAMTGGAGVSGESHYVEMDQGVAQLAKLLDKDFAKLSMQINDAGSARFLKIADNLDADTCQAIAKLHLAGIGFEPQNQRYYPMGSLAAHVLGYTGADGHGLDGLERRFDKELSGVPGWKCELKDARRDPIAVNVDDYRPAEHGDHLVLTVDTNIQLILEQELTSTCEKWKGHGEAVALDPATGEVLALANYPTFNPQDIEDSNPEMRTNRAIVVPYEPGSTIKPFVAGPAMEWHITRMDEVFPTGGLHYITPYGRVMKDVHGYDRLALWDVLVKSSNIGMSMLGERMGNEKIHRALAGFDFGMPTGIELPGENGGKLNPLPKWNKYSTESCSTGYELMVTPMQLARAFCCYANGGRLVQPHLLKGRLDSQGNVVERVQVSFDSLPQVIDPKTAGDIRRILCDVPIRGTATGVRSAIWNIFGKTGTAHIAENHGYSQTRFNSSYLAGAPYEHPRVIVAFIIHDPQGAHYGSAVAAPGATRFLERTLAYMQVEPSPELPLPPSNVQQVLYEFNPHAYDRRTVTALDEN